MPNPLVVARERAEALMARADASAADLTEARRWLERARRLAPADPTAALWLATLCLRLRDPLAGGLFGELAAAHDVREVWVGLAVARQLAGDLSGAVDAAQACLSRHAVFPDIAALAPGLAGQAGLAGWCALEGGGRLTVATTAAPEIRLDGVRVPWRGASGTATLPTTWRAAQRLTVQAGGATVLGSPIDIPAIRRLEGFVSATDGGLSGWAWHPADPDRPPVLTLLAGGPRPLHAIDTDVVVPGITLLARARGFTVPAAGPGGAPVRVVDQDGRDLLGSPLDPGAEQRAAAGLARLKASGEATSIDWLSVALHVLPRPALRRPKPRAEPAVVVVLIMDDTAPDRALQHLLATTAAEICVVDATTYGAALGTAQPDRVKVLHAAGPGRADAISLGLRHAGACDVALVDATIRLAPGWLEQLQAACRSAPDVGTSSPLDIGRTASTRPGPAAAVDIPVSTESCVYLRRACLSQLGALNAIAFAQGEGAVADACLRATALGWRHVAVLGVTAARDMPASPARTALAQRNHSVLSRLHPGLDALLARHDPAMAETRRRLDADRWPAGRQPAGAVILITHAHGGGVERHVRERCDLWRKEGRRPIVLRPAGPNLCHVGDGAEGGFDALHFRLPEELPGLVSLLRPDRVALVELHHWLGHHHAVLELAGRLAVPCDIFVHDFAWFCPRISLVGRERRYCGEPDLAGCEACVADLGHELEEDIGVAALRARSATDLGAARRVVAPSQDAAARLRRHFPTLRQVVTPWEPEPPPAPAPPRPASGPTRICVVGALGVEKGFDILLACARDAAARALALDFVVVGHTIDDARLMDTGRVFVTGKYAEAEAVALIAAQQAVLGFVPSVCPETWCYTLGHLWAAGLPAVAFDLGAPAERIRRSGRGEVLPLGLSAGGINHALLACAARVSNHHAPKHFPAAGPESQPPRASTRHV